MVQLMAQKLEHLQGNPEKGNNNQSPISAITNNYVPKTKKQLKEEYARVNAQQKQEKNQGVPLQNSKKIWSPRAHQQMMKNMKQKNVEQKSSVHKPGIGQLLRKKSASQFNLFEDGSSKPKKQVISMKQCLSFGKSNGFAPLNIQQSDQKQKIQKPEMHLPSQAPENPKKQLFQFPADPQKPSYYKNLGSSPSQPVFRNVFGS